MRFRSLLASCLAPLLVAVSPVGCGSGQTGSPDCVGATSCLCDRLYGGGVLLRVHGESEQDGKLVAVIDGLSSPADRTLDLRVGDRVGGAMLAQLPCAPEKSVGPLAGAELFVLYSPGGGGAYLNCPEFQSCAEANCVGLAEPELPMCWDMCQADSQAACAQRREAALLDGVFSWVVPWGDELSFGGDKKLSSADVLVVADVDSCLEHFPPPPAPPCNDVQVGCSVAGQTPAPRWAWGGSFLAISALAWGCRRATRGHSAPRVVR